MKNIQLTTEEEEALMFVFRAALGSQDFTVATNVVLLRQKILNTPIIPVPAESTTQE